MLICDLAEYYHVYDYRSLPVKLVVTFFVGLRGDSRIRTVNKTVKVNETKWLLMLIVDNLTILNYKLSGKTVDTKELLTGLMLNEAEKKEKVKVKTKVFESSDDFMNAWKEATQKGA